jgi:hypothetical protein
MAGKLNRMRLAICSSCSRHVRESICPFCGASVAQTAGVKLPRMSRIALVGAAAAVAATALAGCSAEASYGCACPLPDAGETDAETFEGSVPFYGGAPHDASASDVTASDASFDASDAGSD